MLYSLRGLGAINCIEVYVTEPHKCASAVWSAGGGTLSIAIFAVFHLLMTLHGLHWLLDTPISVVSQAYISCSNMASKARLG